MEKKVILAIDDEVLNLNQIEHLIDDSSYELIDTTDPEDFFEVLYEEKIDLVLLDILMPKMSGFDICKKIREDKNFIDLPILFMTNDGDENTLEKAYEVGGSDFIQKPLRKKEFLARIKTQIRLNTLIDELKFISYHDTLTGIYNRRKFFELANDLYENNNEDLYAIMIDIDKFKSVNDRFGHAIGDKVIVNMAHTVRDILPKNTLFARIGGEEFIILINTKDDIKELSENIREGVFGQKIILENEEVLTYSISLGTSKYLPSFKNLDQFLDSADSALYDAKNSGRNRSMFRNL